MDNKFSKENLKDMTQEELAKNVERIKPTIASSGPMADLLSIIAEIARRSPPKTND